MVDTAGVIGQLIGVMLTAFGSDDMNSTPRLELAIPVDGIAGQVDASTVPLGTRPNITGS